MFNLLIQYLVAVHSDRVETGLGFKKTVHVRVCKSCIATEEPYNIINPCPLWNTGPEPTLDVTLSEAAVE